MKKLNMEVRTLNLSRIKRWTLRTKLQKYLPLKKKQKVRENQASIL